MNRKKIAYSMVLSALLLSACGSDNKTSILSDTLDINQSKEHYINQKVLGGETTDIEFKSSTHAFSQPAANLKGELFDFHLEGDANFEINPEGIGPVFNDTNCNACHQRDGRDSLPVLEHLPEFNNFILKDKNGWYKLGNEGTFLRISIENANINSAPKSEANCWGAPKPVPNFSDQLMCYPKFRQVPLKITQLFDILAS